MSDRFLKTEKYMINHTEIVLTMDPITDVPTEAIVLSANNRLVLRGATGMAGWLNVLCPNLHEECQKLRVQNEIIPGRGILPGSGVVTFGPNNKRIIHAVSVDYDRTGSTGTPYAGIDTVSAATLFSIPTAIYYGFTSIAITPMCTRGHANMTLPLKLAEYLLPRIQIQVIFGKISTLKSKTIEQIYFCIHEKSDMKRQLSQFSNVQEELDRLISTYTH